MLKPADAAALRLQASERLCPIVLDVTDQASINLARDEVVQSIGEDGLVGLVNNSRLGQSVVPPKAASRAIAHALTAKRARNTYFVGPGAHLYNIASKLVYGRLRDWVIMRSIGLSNNA